MADSSLRKLVGVTALALALAASAVQAAQRELRPDGPGLARAVAAAAPGDILHLAAGVYRGNVRVDKPLALIGRPGAVIDGGGAGDVIRIAAPGVIVRGLRLIGSGSNLTKMNAAVFIERAADDAIVEDNDIETNGFGIWLDGCEAARVLGNRIQGNRTLRSQDRGNGVHLFNTTGAIVEGNEIWHARDGIYIDTSNHNTLRRNVMHDLRYGIHYMYSHHNQVIENETRRTRTGYALMQSRDLTVLGNRSENDQNYGILMNYIVDSTIRGNRVVRVQRGRSPGGGGPGIVGAEGKAIFIYNSQFNKIGGNVFGHSDLGIHLTAGSEGNAIYGNAFVNNRTQVKYVATRLQEWSRDGRGNYWSDYLGWDLNADGIGDRPYEPNDDVDRMLWKYPAAKVLMHSPALQTLRWVQARFPVLRAPGVKDSHPLMTIPESLEATT